MRKKIDDIIKSCVADDIKDKYGFEPTAKGFSATLYANSLLNIDMSKKSFYTIIFRNNEDLINDFPSNYEVIKKRDENYDIPIYWVNVEKNEDKLIDALNDLRTVITKQQEFIFELHPADLKFGCCSHYEECSNVGACIMYAKDRPFYKGCAYKENLENGRIFYGEKRNV